MVGKGRESDAYCRDIKSYNRLKFVHNVLAMQNPYLSVTNERKR